MDGRGASYVPPMTDAADLQPGDSQGNAKPYSVSELAFALKRTLEDAYGFVRLRGEVSKVTRHSNGHVYLTLKDERAAIDGVVWKGQVRRLGVQPEQGLVVYGEDHVDPEGREVVEGLHVSASTGTLSRLCNLKGGRFQCFAGYAGWGPGQLEREIADGAWILSTADPILVLDLSPETIWERALRDMGIDPAAIVPGGAES